MRNALLRLFDNQNIDLQHQIVIHIESNKRHLSGANKNVRFY